MGVQLSTRQLYAYICVSLSLSLSFSLFPSLFLSSIGLILVSTSLPLSLSYSLSLSLYPLPFSIAFHPALFLDFFSRLSWGNVHKLMMLIMMNPSAPFPKSPQVDFTTLTLLTCPLPEAFPQNGFHIITIINFPCEMQKMILASEIVTMWNPFASCPKSPQFDLTLIY